MAIDHALKDVLQVGIGLDIVELRSFDERADGGPPLPTPVRTGKHMVLAPKRHRSDGTLDGIVVEFNPAIFEEAVDPQPRNIPVDSGHYASMPHDALARTPLRIAPAAQFCPTSRSPLVQNVKKNKSELPGQSQGCVP